MDDLTVRYIDARPGYNLQVQEINYKGMKRIYQSKSGLMVLHAVRSNSAVQLGHIAVHD